jgi:4-carboxymuconolactone decarboxylase
MKLMKNLLLAVGAMAISGLPFATASDDRLPPLPPEKYDEAQRKAAEEFLRVRNVRVFGPFEVLIRSPELMTSACVMGNYLRYNSAIGTTMSELVILMIAREWSQDFEWSVHAPLAAKQGISTEIIDAIAAGRRPTKMNEDETIVFDFVDELNRNHRVSDESYGRAVRRFGEKGVVDMTGIAGYYTFLSFEMNAAHTPAPANGSKLSRFPD